MPGSVLYFKIVAYNPQDDSMQVGAIFTASLQTRKPRHRAINNLSTVTRSVTQLLGHSQAARPGILPSLLTATALPVQCDNSAPFHFTSFKKQIKPEDG